MSGHLSTRIYDEGDGFYFDIINFPSLKSNIPTPMRIGNTFASYIGIQEIAVATQTVKNVSL